ncbi:succinate--CoA ligase subunit alpha [Candidatus Bipolaricaulota bacterium]|nr:succinate--CoA ligase subunit alpha [Candidatus Bipolaricaulota bacterium]
MSILIGSDTRVLVQGMTGNEGQFHARQMRDYGTQIVAGVTPGKGGQDIDGIPIFDTVSEGVKQTDANASIIFVPPAFSADAILEAADAGIKLIVCLTEGIPVNDMLVVRKHLDSTGVRLVGPNTPGLISPGKCKLGVMAGYIHKPGHIGIISRSGTLTYEVVHQLTSLGIGQSTCVGIGGDPIIGLTFSDLLCMFEADADTHGMILIGEIGGSAEENAARIIAESITKPVVAFIAGQTAPPGRRMGHAGAIVSGGSGTAAAKIEELRSAGVTVAESPAHIGRKMDEILSN